MCRRSVPLVVSAVEQAQQRVLEQMALDFDRVSREWEAEGGYVPISDGVGGYLPRSHAAYGR